MTGQPRGCQHPLLDREEGSAIVEFVFLAVLLLIPLIYLTMMIARVQAGSYAVAHAAREAGRAFVTAESAEAGRTLRRRSPSRIRASTRNPEPSPSPAPPPRV